MRRRRHHRQWRRDREESQKQGTHWNLNSGWTATGSGVTFYYADASSYIQFNSGVKANLSAPTSGTYAHVLMFEPNGLSTSSFAVDGTSTSDLLQGLIYLPSRNVTFNSAANATATDSRWWCISSSSTRSPGRSNLRPKASADRRWARITSPCKAWRVPA